MKVFIWLVVLVCAAACARDFSNETGQPISLDAVRQIHVGKTNATTVSRLLGTPRSRNQTGNTETWNYNHTISNSKLGGGLFPSVGDISVGIQQKDVMVRFTNGIVSACSLLIQDGKVESVFKSSDIPINTTDCDRQ